MQLLAGRYGWTLPDIAALTPAQIAGFLDALGGDSGQADLVTFNSVREAMTFIAQVGRTNGQK